MLIGRIRATVVEHSTDVAILNPSIVSITAFAGDSELPTIEHLLSDDAVHGERLARGDVCLVAAVDGTPAGLLWLNLVGHVDRYLGRSSRPSPEAAYYNQLIVDPKFRRQGVARELIVAALGHAATAHRSHVRAAVLDGNTASAALHRTLGFRPVRRVLGARIGPASVRIALPPRGGAR